MPTNSHIYLHICKAIKQPQTYQPDVTSTVTWTRLIYSQLRQRQHFWRVANARSKSVVFTQNKTKCAEYVFLPILLAEIHVFPNVLESLLSKYYNGVFYSDVWTGKNDRSTSSHCRINIGVRCTIHMTTSVTIKIPIIWPQAGQICWD